MKLIYETKLNDEIVSQIELVQKIDTTTEDGVRASECLSKLIDRSIKLKELEIESDLQVRKLNDEYELKAKEIENAKQGQMIDTGVKVGMFLLSGALYLYAHKSSLRFEKDDTASFMATKEVFKKGLSLLKLG